MFLLLMLALVAFCLIVVPLLLVALAIKLAIGLLFLPFRIAGFVFRIASGLVVGIVFGLVGLLVAGVVLLIPLLPIIAVVGGIWLIVRMSRRRQAATLVVG